MFPPLTITPTRCGPRNAAAEDGGQRRCARAFGELLVALEQEQDRARNRLVLDGHHVVHERLNHGERARWVL